MSLEITSTRWVEPEQPGQQPLLEVTLSHEYVSGDLCAVRVTPHELDGYGLFQSAVKRQTRIDFECMHVTPSASHEQQQREWRRHVDHHRMRRVAQAMREAGSGSRPGAEAEDTPSDATDDRDPTPESSPRPPLRRPAGRRVIECRPRSGTALRWLRHHP